MAPASDSSPLLPSPEASTSPAGLEAAKPELSFWSSFAKRAKAVLLEDGIPSPGGGVEAGEVTVSRKESFSPCSNEEGEVAVKQQRQGETPVLQKGLDAIAASLAMLGDTIGSAIEDGLNLAKTAEFGAAERKAVASRSSATRRSHDVIAALQQQRLSSMGLPAGGEAGFSAETQLKASRDVAMAMASKAKTLFRELRTVKSDLAFLRERCSQLEEENKRLRESVVTGVRPEEDDLVRLQLETLLTEKSRLAQENANYCRENQFLREVVEYHQLSLQDDLPLPVVDDTVVEDISDDEQQASSALDDHSTFVTPVKLN